MQTDDLYEFTLPDGSKRLLTISSARGFGDKQMNKRCDEIVDTIRSKNKNKYKKDSFVPGWQENIRMYITCPHKYKRALKDLGLVEIGNDYIPTQVEVDYKPFDSDEMIRTTLEAGIYLSGNEIEAIRSGEFFDDLRKRKESLDRGY